MLFVAAAVDPRGLTDNWDTELKERRRPTATNSRNLEPNLIVQPIIIWRIVSYLWRRFRSASWERWITNSSAVFLFFRVPARGILKPFRFLPFMYTDVFDSNGFECSVWHLFIWRKIVCLLFYWYCCNLTENLDFPTLSEVSDSNGFECSVWHLFIWRKIDCLLFYWYCCNLTEILDFIPYFVQKFSV